MLFSSEWRGDNLPNVELVFCRQNLKVDDVQAQVSPTSKMQIIANVLVLETSISEKIAKFSNVSMMVYPYSTLCRLSAKVICSEVLLPFGTWLVRNIHHPSHSFWRLNLWVRRNQRSLTCWKSHTLSAQRNHFKISKGLCLELFSWENIWERIVWREPYHDATLLNVTFSL